MQRAISRAFRGTCRKWRENDCPIAAGEEVRRKKEEDGKKDFVPPKHTWEEAVTWTSGLVLGYHLTHGRRRSLIEECTPITALHSRTCSSLSPAQGKTTSGSETSCPFSMAPRVFNQPIFSPGPGVSSALHVNRKISAPARYNKTSSSATVVSSIDITPFIHEDIEETELPEKLTSPSVVEDDDIVFAFEAEEPEDETKKEVSSSSGFRKPSVLHRINNNPAEYGTRFGADLLSMLGAFEFLCAENQEKSDASPSEGTSPPPSSSKKEAEASPSPKDPPMHALELLKKGAELGSCRALYNMGVAYERMNDLVLAKEYYRKAADLGHPLATYNSAVFAFQDGRLTEGYALMKTASDFGVPEAREFMKPSMNRNEAVAVKIEMDKV